MRFAIGKGYLDSFLPRNVKYVRGAEDFFGLMKNNPTFEPLT